jgi:flagellar biosynthetic protein FliS
MSAVAALATYANASAVTASPHQVVRMAYERVATACDRAEQAELHEAENWMQIFHDEMLRGQAILLELTGALALTHEDPAVLDLSLHLRDLYRFAIDQLIDANVNKDPGPLDAVRLVVLGLHDAWIRRAA